MSVLLLCSAWQHISNSQWPCCSKFFMVICTYSRHSSYSFFILFWKLCFPCSHINTLFPEYRQSRNSVWRENSPYSMFYGSTRHAISTISIQKIGITWAPVAFCCCNMFCFLGRCSSSSSVICSIFFFGAVCIPELPARLGLWWAGWLKILKFSCIFVRC